MEKAMDIRDIDGLPIREGDVLRNIEDGDQGVVLKIWRAGDVSVGLPKREGELSIGNGDGSERVTNLYHKWRHVPKNGQTHWQRFVAWTRKPLPSWWLEDANADVRVAVSGIMALIPDGRINFDACNPETTEEALQHLARYLDTLAKKEGSR